MKDWKAKKTEKIRKENSKVIKHFVYGVSFLVIILLAIIFLHPFYFYSGKLISKGDDFLLQRKYAQAHLQYEKALIINPWDAKAKSRLELADKGREDILALTDFFKQKNDQAMLDKIELATSVPENETQALKISKQFADEGDYQLALLPAQTALQMDPEYKQAQEYVRLIQTEAKKSR